MIILRYRVFGRISRASLVPFQDYEVVKVPPPLNMEQCMGPCYTFSGLSAALAIPLLWRIVRLVLGHLGLKLPPLQDANIGELGDSSLGFRV